MPRRVLQAPIPPQQGFKPELKLIWTPEFPLGTGGLVTSLPAIQLNPDQAVELTNWDFLYGALTPRYGYNYSVEAGTDQIGKAVWNVKEFELLDGSEHFMVAVTENDLWSWDYYNDTWSKETESGGVSWDPSGGADVGQMKMVQDSLIMTTSTAKPHRFVGEGQDIVILSANATTGMLLIESFADRIILAGGLTGTIRQRIEWSVSGDITDFTGTGSGSVLLVDNPEDPVDEIMGMTVHGDLLIIYRRNSIWVGQRTGVPVPALAFQARVQGIGCASHWGCIKVGPEGDVFADLDNIYFYSPGDRQPIPIGDAIKKELREAFSFIEGNMDWNTEISMAVRQAPGRELVVVLNKTTMLIFDLDAFFNPTDPKIIWRKYSVPDEFLRFGWMPYLQVGPAVRYTLVGASLDHHVYWFSNEAMSTYAGPESVERWTDGGSLDGTTPGTTITCTYVSPAFHLPDTYIQLAKLALTYRHDDSKAENFPITISTSIDGGETWDNARTYNLRPCDEDRTVEFGIREAYGDSVMFKIECEAYDYSGSDDVRPQIRLINYKLGLIPRGEKRTRNLMVHKDLKLQWDILST